MGTAREAEALLEEASQEAHADAQVHGVGGLVSQWGSTIKSPWAHTVTSRYPSWYAIRCCHDVKQQTNHIGGTHPRGRSSSWGVTGLRWWRRREWWCSTGGRRRGCRAPRRAGRCTWGQSAPGKSRPGSPCRSPGSARRPPTPLPGREGVVVFISNTRGANRVLEWMMQVAGGFSRL